MLADHQEIYQGLSTTPSLNLFFFFSNVSFETAVQVGHGGHERLGGFVGMSGWLPFEQQLKDLSQTRASDSELFSPDTEIDPFTFSSDRHDVSSGETRLTALEAVNHVRDILDLATLDSTSADEPTNAGPQEKQQSSANISLSGPIVGYLKLPVFIGHGALDPKVSVRLGKKMADFLSTVLGMKVTWKAYEGLGY